MRRLAFVLFLTPPLVAFAGDSAGVPAPDLPEGCRAAVTLFCADPSFQGAKAPEGPIPVLKPLPKS